MINELVPSVAQEAGIDFVHAAYGFGTISQPVDRIDSIDELLVVADKIFND